MGRSVETLCVLRSVIKSFNSMKSSKKNLEIEYLRAVAILITMYGHLGFLMPYHELRLAGLLFGVYSGWPGVDLFFCISGFVIAKSYAEMFESSKRDGIFGAAFKYFWIKRAYRLLPSAWLWAAIVLGCAIFFNSTGVFLTLRANVNSIVSILTFSGNLANQSGLYLEPNGVYWSLALEEQFYFIFPLFLLITRNNRMRAMILLALVVVQFFIDRNPFAGTVQAMLSSFRLDAIMLGILLYYLSRSPVYQQIEPVGLRNSPIKRLLIALLLIFLLGAVPAQLSKMPIVVGLVAVISFLLVFLASFERGYVLSIPLLSRVLAWFGSRSYGLYLIHVPGYRIAYEGWSRYAAAHGHKLDASYTVEMFVSAILMILLLTELNYRLVEVPLRRRGAKLATEGLEESRLSQGNREQSQSA